VTVKLKHHGITQRFKTLTASRIRERVETAVRDNTATQRIKIVAAHQLKSGDIQIFTSTMAEATKLKESKGWLRGLGEHAELIVPTYGVIVHGISTKSIDIKDQKATIQQIVADNYTVIPKAEISFVGWLTKESPLKRASSIVVEFTDPEMANAIIYAGMVWEGQIHTCQLYDRAYRVKQCFRCYNYGHIGTQCNAAQTCGYCAELHETKNCRQKGADDFVPRCAVCKGAHTAWSNACPARRKEMGRVEQAKQTRNTYWQVTSKDDAPRQDPAPTRSRHTHEARTTETATGPANEEIVVARGPSTPEAAEANPQTCQTQPETTTRQASVIGSLAEDWATPATRQGHAQYQQEFPIDPQLLGLEMPAAIVPAYDMQGAGSSANAATQPTLDPQYNVEGSFSMEDVDVWLANMMNGTVDDQHDEEDNAISPPTSTTTDTQANQGRIYRACACPEHQEAYEDWPLRNANLTIVRCMRICPYCGKDIKAPTNLRKHLWRMECVGRNLTVNVGIVGRNRDLVPSWTVKEPQPESSMPGTDQPDEQPTMQAIRSQSTINRANPAPSE
jgi:hypothetical protein